MPNQPTRRSVEEANDLLCSCHSKGLPPHPTLKLHPSGCLKTQVTDEDVERIALALDRRTAEVVEAVITEDKERPSFGGQRFIDAARRAAGTDEE